jgi:hypothetical protein
MDEVFVSDSFQNGDAVFWGQRTARIEVTIAQTAPLTATARLSCASSDPAEAAPAWTSMVGVTPTPVNRLANLTPRIASSEDVTFA